MTRRIGENCCPTNTEPFEMAVRSNEVWTYYVYNWNTDESEVNYITLTLCYFRPTSQRSINFKLSLSLKVLEVKNIYCILILRRIQKCLKQKVL